MAKTTALIILDGWAMGKDYPGNAIKLAATPTWDKLLQECPKRELIACGEQVGLPEGQMGNSEVGHLILGAGRIVYQTLLRINKAIADKSIQQNTTLNTFLQKCVSRATLSSNSSNPSSSPRLHIMGLLSDGGVHSHQEHLAAVLRLAAAKGIKNIELHLFLDGRDSAPNSAPACIDFIQQQLKETGVGRISSVIGRYYAMDRDKRWERTQKAYDLLVSGKGEVVDDTKHLNQKLQEYYAKEITDEFIPPLFVRSADQDEQGKQGKQESRDARDGVISADDSIICINFRADRVRQITAALASDNFNEFNRPFVLPKSSLLTMTSYDEKLPLPFIFEREKIVNCLGEVLANLNKKQLRLAETEKFAHVTYFFNGGKENPFANEERKLIPSLKVATYDLAPQMRAPEITAELIAAFESQEYDFILCNYANGDMVGHSGKMDAAIKAAEHIDESLSQLMPVIRKNGAQALITADHGNCEEMLAADGVSPYTAHTLNPVPLLYYGDMQIELDTQPAGLADIAPTLLKLMGLLPPSEMSGRALIR